MKKRSWAILAIGLLLTAGAGAVRAGEAAPAENAVEARSSGNNFANMGRGLVNILTCFLEVPRCLLYRNSQVPVLGVVAGACEGAGLTGVRAFAGAADLLSFGFMTDVTYRVNPNFHEWVWDSPWVQKY